MQAKLPSATQVSCLGMTESTGSMCIGAADDSLELAHDDLRPAAARDGAEDRRPPASCFPRPDRVLRLLPRSGEHGARRSTTTAGSAPATSCALDADGHVHVRRSAEGHAQGRRRERRRGRDRGLPATHPAVDVAAVVAAPDARYGEVPCAYVRLAPGVEAIEEELIELLPRAHRDVQGAALRALRRRVPADADREDPEGRAARADRGGAARARDRRGAEAHACEPRHASEPPSMR